MRDAELYHSTRVFVGFLYQPPLFPDGPEMQMLYLIQSCSLLQALHSEAHAPTPPGGTLASLILGEAMLLGSSCPAPSSGASTAPRRGSQPCSHQLLKETDPAQRLELLHQSLCAMGSWLKMIPWERPRDAACSTMAQDLSHLSLPYVPETELLPTTGQLSAVLQVTPSCTRCLSKSCSWVLYILPHLLLEKRPQMSRAQASQPALR